MQGFVGLQCVQESARSLASLSCKPASQSAAHIFKASDIPVVVQHRPQRNGKLQTQHCIFRRRVERPHVGLANPLLTFGKRTAPTRRLTEQCRHRVLDQRIAESICNWAKKQSVVTASASRGSGKRSLGDTSSRIRVWGALVKQYWPTQGSVHWPDGRSAEKTDWAAKIPSELETSKSGGLGALFICALAVGLLVGSGSLFTPAAQALSLPFFGPSQEKDPVEPFVIYGTIDKKFLIEKIEEGRIVGRKKGFTASVCAKCVGANAETPEFLGLPTGMKMEEAPGEQSCSKWEAQSKDEACAKPCKRSCEDAIARQVRLERASTGYELDPGDRQKATRGCITSCENECAKPGRSSAFVVPVRP